MGCSAECQAYKLGPIMEGMLTQMTSTYDDIQTLIYVSAIGGGLCLLWAFYLILLKTNATQDEYMKFWAACLLVLVVVCILVGMIVNSMSKSYNAQRNQLPKVAACITDTTWKKVPAAMYNQSSMESEHNWAIFFLVAGIVLALAMLYFFMTVT